MQTEEVLAFYNILNKKKATLIAKRIFELICALFVLIIMSPFFLIIAVSIKLDSKGPVFFKQVRVARYNKDFKIFKFRTMVNDADKKGIQITVGGDSRITRVGKILRKTRLDEFPQMINILIGDMSLIGTRPEVRKYVDHYTNEHMATLLLPPGVTGSASIAFKDENDMLSSSEDPEKTYINEILPIKMGINLEYVKNVSFWLDIKILLQTFACIFK